MSDTITINPYAPGTPEYDQFNQGLNSGIKAVPNALTRFPVGLVSSLLSSPDATGAERFIPSAATGLYSFANDAQHLIGRLLQPVTGAPPVDLPGAAEAGKLTQGAADFATTLVPHVAPSNPMEATLGDMAQSAGQMGPFIGESPLSAMSPALKAMTEFALPGLASKAAPVVGAALTGGVDAVTGSASASTTGQPQTVTVPLEDQQPTDQSQPMQQPGQLPLPPPLPPELTRVSNPATTPTAGAWQPIQLPTDTLKEPETGLDWGHAALYGAGALAVLAGARYSTSFLRALTDTTHEALYRDASIPYNSGETVPAPLPGSAGSIATGIKNATVDSNATVDAYVNAIAQTPQAAWTLRAQNGIVNNAQATGIRIANIARTGEDPVSGISMPSNADHWDAIAALSADQQALYNDALHAANELDNRTNNVMAFIQQNGVPPQTPEEIANTRVNFKGNSALNIPPVDDATLRSQVAAGDADPTVAALRQEWNLISQAKIHIAEARGMLSSEDAAKILQAHPNYLPDADISGMIEYPFSARDITPHSGLADPSVTPAWELQKQHLEAFYGAMEQNELNTNIVRTGLGAQTRDPGAAQIFTPSQDAEEQWVKAEGTIPIRVDGELQYWNVGSPVLRTALEQSPASTNAVIGAMNSFRAAVQSTITGNLALLAGHVFAPKMAVRTALQGSIMRPSGTAGGYLDKGLQLATGGRLGIPDPTALLTMPYEWLAGAGAEGAHGIAAILGPNASNIINTKLRAQFGDPFVDALHDRAQATWANSIRGQMTADGSTNAAGMSSTVVPTQQMGAEQSTYSPLNNVSPNLFRVQGPLGSVMPTFVRWNDLLNTVKSIISEAGHEQFYRLNPQLPPDVRTYETRQLIGDPGTKGASPIVRGTTETIPFSNIAIQEVARVARAWKENPAFFTAGIGLSLGLPILAEQLTALASGPAASDHLQDEMSNAEAASYINLYLPGSPVDIHPRIPVGITLQPFVPLMRQMVGDIVASATHATNPDHAQWVWDGLRDFFSHHITQSTVSGTVAGVSAATPPITPAIAQAVSVPATNRVLDPTLDQLYQHWDQLAQPSNVLSQPVGGTMRNPGTVPGTDPLFDSVAGKTFQDTMSSVFGFAATNAYSYANTFKQAMEATHDPSFAWGNVIQDYKVALQDSLPMADGILWNHNNRLALQTPLVQRVEQSLDAMRPLANWKSDEKYQGMTRKGGVALPLSPGQQSSVPTDPVVQGMWATTGVYMGQIAKYQLPQIEDLRKQMIALDNSPLTPDAKQTLRNQFVRQIHEKYSDVADIINGLNGELSRQAGKPVTVRTINWTKDASQFAGPRSQPAQP